MSMIAPNIIEQSTQGVSIQNCSKKETAKSLSTYIIGFYIVFFPVNQQ